MSAVAAGRALYMRMWRLCERILRPKAERGTVSKRTRVHGGQHADRAQLFPWWSDLSTVPDVPVPISGGVAVNEEPVTLASLGGGALVEHFVALPNPVRLKPYRTFREVSQPGSLFVVRAKRADDGGLPKVALFEADGGKWKLEAIDNIRQYLTSKIADIPILA